MKRFGFIATFISSLIGVTVNAQTTRPAPEQALVRAIYQEFIAVNSGFSTGATTPVVQAAVARLKAAGFSDSDIQIAGAHPNKMNLVVR